MKKLFILFSIFCLKSAAQVPATINYQAVARDAAGAPITNTVVNLQFKISTSTSANFYAETQNAVAVNSLGLLSTKIGISSPLPLTGWQNAPVVLQVFIDVNGSGFISMGSQTLSSVPFALYALQSGNSLPPGTRNGQTLRWDSASNAWQNSNNLTNNESRVGVGIFPNSMDSKMSVVSLNVLDTAALTAVHYVAQNKTAAIRGVALGNSVPSSTTNVFASSIFGGQHLAYNAGNGSAIGNMGIGSSKGYGVGVAGYGVTQLSSGSAIGIYGTADTLSPGTNKYAAVFDRGAVLIGDSLVMNPLKNPGNLGDVLTLTGFNGRVKWKPAGGPWQRSLFGTSFNTHLVNPTDHVNIGLPSGVGANEIVHINNSGGDAYIQLSTAANSNAVGLVFGELSNLNKGAIQFDNFSNTLLYQLFGQPILFIDGGFRSTLIGKIPPGSASQSALNAYDSIGISAPMPILKVMNTNTVLNVPTALFLGHNNVNGFNLTYRKGFLGSTFSIEDNSFGTKFHTFNDNGRFYPGSDGGAGKANIQGGANITDDLILNSSTNGNIIHAGYTQMGNTNNTIYPAIQVLEFTSTMPNTAGGNTQISLSSYIPNSGKIESVQVLITTANRIVPQNFTLMPGYECQYEISPTVPTITVWSTSANSSQILGQPVKILVTIKK